MEISYEQYLEEVKDLRRDYPEILKDAQIQSWTDEKIAKTLHYYMSKTGKHAGQAICDLYLDGE